MLGRRESGQHNGMDLSGRSVPLMLDGSIKLIPGARIRRRDMTSQGQDPHRSSGTQAAAASRGPARSSRISGRDNRMAWRLIGLAMLGQMLRSRPFYERVVFAAVALGALSTLSQENRARAFARLVAWNERQVQLLEHKAEREAKRLARKAKGTLTAG